MAIKRLLAAFFGAAVILSFASISALADSTGWREESGGWRYYTTEKSYVKHEWKSIDGQWYFFDDYGLAVTDMWMFTNGKMYHFDSKGHMEKNKWIDCGEHKLEYSEKEYASQNSEYAQVLKEYQGKRDWRYVGSDGAALIGWQKIDGQWYYFNDLNDGYCSGFTVYMSGTSDYGKMHYGWLSDENFNIQYNFDGNGHYRKNCWYKGTANSGKVGWYYFGSDGKAISGWKKINNNWYLFYEFWGAPFMQTGKAVSNTDYKYYMFDDSGKLVSGARWYKTSEGDWVYIKSDGTLALSEWIKSGSQMYYCNQNSKMIANTSYLIDGYEYKFDANGVCQNYSKPQTVSGWYKIDSKLYGTNEDAWTYVGPNGRVYRQEWKYIGNSWYYFDYSGYTVSDVDDYPIDGKLYRFDKDGKCINPNVSYSSGWNKVVIDSEDYWIYCGTDGRFVTGWKKINGNWYYFNTVTGLMSSGDTEYLDDGSYYINEQGKLMTGWIDRGDGDWLYAGSDGKLYENKWFNYNGSWYYFAGGGHMINSNWSSYAIDGKVYNFDDNGKCLNPSGDGYILYEQK